jgi:hypothetical protein
MFVLSNIVWLNSLNKLSEINDVGDSLIGIEMLIVLCLSAVIIFVIYQRKKPKLSKEKNAIKKNLDDYSYRELFHYFLNPEFHADKFHLAKGFYYKKLF